MLNMLKYVKIILIEEHCFVVREMAVAQFRKKFMENVKLRRYLNAFVCAFVCYCFNNLATDH